MIIEKLEVEISAIVQNAIDNMQKVDESIEKTKKEMGNFSGKMNEYSAKLKSSFTMAHMAVTGAMSGILYWVLRVSPDVQAHMTGMKIAAEQLGWAIGKHLAPIFDELEDILWKIKDGFEGLPEPIQKFLAQMILIMPIVTAVLAIFVKLGGAAGVIALLTNPIGLLAVAIGLIVYALINWRDTLAGLEYMLSKVVDFVKDTAGAVADVARGIINDVKNFIDKIASAIDVVGEAFDSFKSKISGFTLPDWMQSMIDKLKYLKELWDALFGKKEEIPEPTTTETGGFTPIPKEYGGAEPETKTIETVFGGIYESPFGFTTTPKETTTESNIVEKAVDMAVKGTTKMVSTVVDIVDTISDAVSWVGSKIGGILGFKQEGGYINQSGLYYLHQGENVMKAGETKSTVINFSPTIYFGGSSSGSTQYKEMDSLLDKWHHELRRSFGWQFH